jgi:glutamyl-tRNA reductase
MKQLPDESYEDWIKRAQTYEYGRALQKIAEGMDPVKALEEMSNRLVNKLLHPVLTAVNNLPKSDNYNAEESLRYYKENYLDRFPRVADHIDDGHINGKD